MQYFELQPRYGRDYKKGAEVEAAFRENKDFLGDFNLNFQTVSKSDLDRLYPQGYTVNLRFKANRNVKVVKITPAAMGTKVALS